MQEEITDETIRKIQQMHKEQREKEEREERRRKTANIRRWIDRVRERRPL